MMLFSLATIKGISLFAVACVRARSLCHEHSLKKNIVIIQVKTSFLPLKLQLQFPPYHGGPLEAIFRTLIHLFLTSSNYKVVELFL
jgi:hypothetical protein